jgi:CheY-like chemotaxis protein
MSTILLVEDSPDDVFFMKRALKQAGVTHSLQVAHDGQAALDYLSGEGPFANRGEFPYPSLVLLDLRMPRVPGFEVLKWIRDRVQFDCMPVIVFSSSKEERDIQKAYGLRANAFLVKSPDPKHLAEMIKAVAGFWLHFNEVPALCEESPVQ